MPLFAAHMPIAAGLHNAARAARESRCNALQMSTKNSNQWNARELTAEEVQTFRRALRQARLRFPTAHDSYLINLASPDRTLYRRSIEAFLIELRRAETLGLSYLV